LLADARAAGALRPDADSEAFLALLMLVLPHLAIAPNHPGLDPVFGLDAAGPKKRGATAERLTAVFRAAFGHPRLD
jgi:hypothetical protein